MGDEATRAPYGVLVLHGLTSSLASVLPVTDRLAPHGIPYAVPWLRGHGTRPEDLIGVTWRDWYADAAAALDELLTRCATASVVGLSMGGLVALHLALERGAALRGVVAVAPALRIANRLAPLVPFVAPFKRWLYPPANGYSEATRARLSAGYTRMPTSAFLALVSYAHWLEPRLGGVQVPTLILQSRADRVVRPDSATRIYARLGTTEKELRWFARSGHEMLVDCEAEAVLDAVEAFLLARQPGPASAGTGPATPQPPDAERGAQAGSLPPGGP